MALSWFLIMFLKEVASGLSRGQTFDVLFLVNAQAQQALTRQMNQLHAIYTSLQWKHKQHKQHQPCSNIDAKFS